MKKCFKLLLALVIPITMFAGSCKLDKPVLPSPKGDDVIITDQTVLGMVVNGRVIDDPYLTSVWKTKQTVQQIYDTAYIVLSGSVVANPFSAVSINDKEKSVKYSDLVNNIPSAGTYSLETDSNVLYIKLSENPFFSSTFSTVRITHLTATEMTWVALDTTSTVLDGRYFHKGYQVTFTK